MIDEKKLSEWQAACDAATAGPWEARNLGYGYSNEVIRKPSGAPDDGGDIVAASTWKAADAAFIALARTGLPEAIAELRRLRAVFDAAYVLCLDAPTISDREEQWDALAKSIDAALKNP